VGLEDLGDNNAKKGDREENETIAVQPSNRVGINRYQNSEFTQKHRQLQTVETTAAGEILRRMEMGYFRGAHCFSISSDVTDNRCLNIGT
jgi:hypothetical protein